MLNFLTKSPEETFSIGEKFAQLLKEGTVICLQGDLGAGKTLFVQGLAVGLGIAEEVTSPTFALLNIYQGSKTLYHFDLYRLDFSEELCDIGFYEYLEKEDGITVIEWPDKFKQELPEEYLLIKIKRTEGVDERSFEISCHGTKYNSLLEEFVVK